VFDGVVQEDSRMTKKYVVLPSNHEQSIAVEQMECSVCYETGPCRKLCCGHEFCSGCIKSWYLKGTGTGCPMCRRPIYFKGFHRVEEQWSIEAWETRCSEVFEHSVEDVIQNVREMLDQWPHQFHAFFTRKAMKDLRATERMFSVLKESGYESEEIDYLLNETDMYFAKLVGRYIPTLPRYEKASYKPVVHKAMRFKKNNVR